MVYKFVCMSPQSILIFCLVTLQQVVKLIVLVENSNTNAIQMPIIETANRKPRPQHAAPPPPQHTVIASTKLPPRICGSILKALIPQICFLRAQIPCPLDVLEKHRRRQQETGGRIGRTREISMRAER